MKIGELFRLAAGRYVANHEGSFGTLFTVGLKEDLGLIAAEVSAFNERHEAAERDMDLTATGRQKVQAKLAEGFRKFLATIEAKALQAATRARGEEAPLLAAAAKSSRPTTTDAYSIALHVEGVRSVWNELRGLSLLERTSAYVDSKDPLVLDALETAPPILRRADGAVGGVWEPFVAPDAIASRRMQRAAAADPTIAKSVLALDDVASILTEVATTLSNELGILDPLNAPPKFRHVKAGEETAPPSLRHISSVPSGFTLDGQQ